MAEKAASLSDKLKAISDRFAAKIDQKTADIEAACELFLSSGKGADAPGARAEAINLTHRLAGSSGSMGFPELGDAAKALEVSLIAVSGDAAAEARRAITPAVEAFAAAARRKTRAALPAAAAVEQAPAAVQPAAEKLIYLLDGDRDSAGDLSLQLGYFGYTVEAFADTGGLGDALSKETPAAMMVDFAFVGSGGMGIEALSSRRQADGAVPPSIFISHLDDLETRLGTVRAGGDAFFTKPLDMGRLVEILDGLTAYAPPDPYRVLVIDDVRDLAESYALILEDAGLETQVVTDPMEVMKPLTEFQPDLLLMDINMPNCSGFELARVIRQQEAYVQIPIIFLTADRSKTGRLSAMETGGDEYLTKPVRPDLLLTSVIGRAERSRTVAAMISRDSMTRLPNHTKIKEHLDMELDRAKRQDHPLSLAMIDIDHFKAVNDTHGHLTGDHVIQALSQVLRQRLRKTDIVGRYGGEEFAAILPNTDGPAAFKVLEGIREGFGRIRHMAADAEFFITFSCGIAAYPPIDMAKALIAAADAALYRAKGEGRNRTALADGKNN